MTEFIIGVLITFPIGVIVGMFFMYKLISDDFDGLLNLKIQEYKQGKTK